MRRVLSANQVRELIAECEPRPGRRDYRPILELTWLTGCRIGEIVHLTRECVEPRPGGWAVFVREHRLPDGRTWRPKRPASVRVVKIASRDASQELSRILTEACELRSGPESACAGLWWPDTHPSVRAVQMAWRAACERTGLLEFSGTHSLRRARLSQAMAAGAPPSTVSEAAGHASLATTILYLGSTGAELELPAADAAPVPNPPASSWLAALRPRSWK